MTGLLWLIVATTLFAATALLAKAGIKKTEPALAGSVSGLAFCILLFLYERENVISYDYQTVTIKQWGIVAVLALAIAIVYYLIFKALSTCEVAVVVSMQQCGWILKILISALVFKNAIDNAMYLPGVLCLAGIVLIIWGTGGKNIKEVVLYSGLAVLLNSAVDKASMYYFGPGENYQIFTFFAQCLGVVLLCGFTMSKGGLNKLKSLSFLDGIYLIGAAAAYAFAWYLFVINYRAGVKWSGHCEAAIVLVLVILAGVTIKEKINAKKIIGALLIMASFII